MGSENSAHHIERENSTRNIERENPIRENTRVATKDSWDIQPMPDMHTTVPMDFKISQRNMLIVKQGHIPEAMEDHWFMYCDENTIRYYRSWTGFCIYIAKYEKVDESNYRITELQINRDPDQFTFTNDKNDAADFTGLLVNEYGGDPTKYWKRSF